MEHPLLRPYIDNVEGTLDSLLGLDLSECMRLLKVVHGEHLMPESSVKPVSWEELPGFFDEEEDAGGREAEETKEGEEEGESMSTPSLETQLSSMPSSATPVNKESPRRSSWPGSPVVESNVSSQSRREGFAF